MKKTGFILVMLCICNLAVLAQQSEQDADSAYMRRCRAFKESLIETVREMKALTKNKNCEELDSLINERIEMYKNAVTNKEKDYPMVYFLARTSCPKVIDFFEQVILSDTSEYIRGQAIAYLGGIDAQSSIPFLLDYYQKNNPSKYEKVVIGATLLVLEAGDYGEQILNEHCFDTTSQIVRLCVFGYQRLGNASSINYFRYMQKMFGVDYFMWDLVRVGDKETALPIIKDWLKKDNPNKKYELDLLELIGDEESINLIKSALNDPHESVRKYAEKILKSIDTRTNKE
jgi:hypothetical protein